MARRLVGCPITFEHAGIGAAAGALGARPSAGTVIEALRHASAASGDLTQRAISVVDSTYRNHAGHWCCTFSLDEALFPRLVAMIAGGSLRGLSLSHFEHDTGDRAPLEVSLCASPARPGSYITAHGLPSPSAVALYKAFDCLMAQPSTSPIMSAANPPSDAKPADAGPDIHSALKDMSEAQRSLVSAALDAMQVKVDEAARKAKEAESETETLRNAASIDKALLQSQIETFIGQIGAEKTKQFGLTTQSCSDALNSDSPDRLRHVVDRMLMCCNTHMMQQHSQAAPAPMSVAADSAADVAVPKVAAEAPRASMKRKAEAEPDEPAVLDAAGRLRAALSSF